ncbi:MAG TPA: PAS domain S-box protein, partial [Rhodopila sp.]|nr:PAS domain S-box protein [Rhodopila sp.]
SVLTASLLWIIVPRLLAIPTPEQLKRVSSQLTEETVRHERTAEQLRRSEESFRLLLESVTDYAVFMMDRNGRITSWNLGAQNITAYRQDEIIGQHYARFFTPEDQADGKPMQMMVAAEADGVCHDEGWRVRKDGSLFIADSTIHSVVDDQGVLIGFSKVTRDITQRRQAERDLEQARSALAQSQKMQAVGQLTGGIAHDFNNMLTAVLGGVELIETRGEPLNAGIARTVRMIRRAAEHGAELTTRLLAFSRKQTLMPGITDVNRLVSETMELVRRTLGSSIMLEMELSTEVWPVFVDANQVEAALLNLAVNARDAMPDGGMLTITTGNVHLDEHYSRRHDEIASGDYAFIAVRDTGCGMAQDVLEHALEPFYTTKGVGKGTGLGLSQVYGFVKQSGGHVELQSRVGVGTTVTMYFPRSRAERAVAGQSAERGGPDLPTGTEKILIVEDEEEVRAYSVTAARHLGYEVSEASDAQMALKVLEQTPGISLILTDVGLPGVNGRDLARMAQESHPGLKVVFTSGYAQPTLAELGLLDRGVRLLPKPFRIESLASVLRSALDTDRADQASESKTGG